MKLFWKLFLSVCICVVLGVSVCGTILIHSGFRDAREREIQSGYDNANLVCFNLVQNTNYMVNLIYHETGYENKKNVIMRQAAEACQIRNSDGTIPFALWTELKSRIYVSAQIKNLDISICREGLPEGKAGHQIVKKEQQYILCTATSFQIMGRTYYVETYKDITSNYENRDYQLQMFREIMIAVLIVCILLVSILNRMMVVPIKRISKATRLVADGRTGIRIKKRGNDEIGMLAEDFNQMSISLNHSMEELKEKNHSQEMFTNNFAHELKTPLTSMIGYADIIRSNKLSDEEIVTYANQIVVEGRRLEKMSIKLMELIVLKKQDFLFYEINSLNFAESVYETLLPVAKKYEISFSIHVQPAIIKIEPDLLKTVFINLFDNARKALKKNGKISLFGVWIGDEYRMGIKDNGCGIEEENVGRLTEAFYMVDKSRARANGGAGLGLAICNEIVVLHQAKLQIMSKKHVGTQVNIVFKEELCRHEENDAQP